MKGKTFIILGLGATGGFIGGNIFAFCKMMDSDKMREAFSSILATKISKILFGDEPSNTNRRVHYHDAYRKTRRPSCYAVEGIIFDTRNDAEKVLNQMQELIDTYGCVCIQDFYDLCGVPNEYHREGKWGWTTLDNVKICAGRNGWLIDMPKAVPVS